MTQPVRVMHVTQTGGGVETYLLEIFRNLHDRRIETSLVCPADLTHLRSEANRLGITTFELPFVREISPKRDLICLIRLARLIRATRPAVLHLHSSKAGALGRIAALGGASGVLYTPHALAHLAGTGFRRTVYLNIERLLKSFTTAVVAGSPSEARRAIQDVGFPQKKVLEYWNSINTEEFSPVRAYRSVGRPLVLMVGRLTGQKDPVRFVEAARIVHQRLPNARFSIVGTGFAGELEDSVRGKISEFGLDGVFELIEWVPRRDLMEYYRTASVLVVPSAYESFGYVAAEASAMEVPVVASDVDGLRDIVEDGVTGYLVPTGDASALADRIHRVLSNPGLACRLGKAGRERIEGLFDVRKNINRLSQIYLRFG